MNSFDAMKTGFNVGFNQLKDSYRIRKAAAKAWKNKALRVDVADQERFFAKKRLKKLKADKLLMAFTVKPVKGGALLLRKRMNYPPESCVTFLNNAKLGALFRVVEVRSFLGMFNEEVKE